MKNKKILLSILILALGFGLVMSTPVLSQGLKNAGNLLEQTGKQAGADTSQSVSDIVGIVIKAALSLVGLIFLVLMVYAGDMWMQAQGEEEKIKKARGIIISAIVGLILVLSAFALTNFITKYFS